MLLVKKRGKKNKRIWDLREKRHKGVEKGDKAFLESLYYTKERVTGRALDGSVYSSWLSGST
jgi:hypothetical protein